MSAITKWQTIAQSCAKSEEEKTLDVFDESESVRMTEIGEFLESVSVKKEGVTLASQSTIRKGLPFLVLCYKHNCVCLTVIMFLCSDLWFGKLSGKFIFSDIIKMLEEKNYG